MTTTITTAEELDALPEKTVGIPENLEVRTELGVFEKDRRGDWPGVGENPYHKPEPPEPFDLDAKLAEAGMPPFPSIRKEDSNG